MWQSHRGMLAECKLSQADKEIKQGGLQTHTADCPAAKGRGICKAENMTRPCGHL